MVLVDTRTVSKVGAEAVYDIEVGGQEVQQNRNVREERLTRVALFDKTLSKQAISWKEEIETTANFVIIIL